MFETEVNQTLAEVAEVAPEGLDDAASLVFLQEVYAFVEAGVRGFIGEDRAHKPRSHGEDYLASTDVVDAANLAISRVASPDEVAARLLGVGSYDEVAVVLATAGVPDSRAALRTVALRVARGLVARLPDVAPEVSDRFPGGITSGTRAWVEVTVVAGPDERGVARVTTGDLYYDSADDGTSLVPAARLHPAPGA